MDNFAEQLVKRNETSADKTRKIMLIICGVLLTAALALLSIMQLNRPIVAFAGLILAAATGYGTFFTVQNAYVEYEYTFTNGELDIDKIIGKKKRVSLISVSIKQFTDFGKYSEDMEETEDMTVVVASDNIASHEYFADLIHEEHGKTRIVFAPDERILENVKKSLPGKLRNKM